MADTHDLTEDQLKATVWSEKTLKSKFFFWFVDKSVKCLRNGMSDSTLEPMSPQMELAVEREKQMNAKQLSSVAWHCDLMETFCMDVK